MSSDEDEELAQLRQQRAARLGNVAGATLVRASRRVRPWHTHSLLDQLSLVQSELRERQLRADTLRAAYFEG